MMEYIDISILNPAEYNPRLLTNEAQEDLKKSIKELGIIKPIIIRQSDKRIMAGHQRTKTMKLLGYTHVPAFILDGVNSTDEVRFNQLHNYAECELSEIQPEINVSLPKGTEGFYTVSNKDISILSKGGNNSRVVDLTKMYNPQIQISAESETKRSIFREKDKTKRSKKESAQHSKSRNKSFVMTSVSAL